jgi:hypothetical protein
MFQRTCKPEFAIAFVSKRIYFLFDSFLVGAVNLTFKSGFVGGGGGGGYFRYKSFAT